ncbi:MAG: hypothetical protein ABFD07_12725 [Methanobacterium sp.]
MFVNNPLDIIVEIVTKKYTKLDVKIWIAEFNHKKIGLGWTQFPKNKSIEIVLWQGMTIMQCTDILAHELAHAIAGSKANHNKKWKLIYTWIHKQYCLNLKNKGDIQ